MEKFKFISSNIHDAYFNLASEEYLLKQKGGYYVYIWINDPSVIVGINQNTLLEVNLPIAEKNHIKVVRRLTGGGAVYHDLQNVNYTIIAPFNSGENNYFKFCSPVIEYLNSIGVKAEFSGRNDICVDGKKISGNAQTIYNDRIMQHGTLLFNTDMSILSSVLIQNKIKVESKGVKSIRARVTNIYNEMPNKITIDEFFANLCEFFKKDLEKYEFSGEDISAIEKLRNEKYSTYEWNIGRSPKGKNRYDARFDFGTLSLCFDLENGLIKNAEVFGDFFSLKDIKEFNKTLENKKFDKEQLTLAFKDIDKYILNANGKEIIEKLFTE